MGVQVCAAGLLVGQTSRSAVTAVVIIALWTWEHAWKPGHVFDRNTNVVLAAFVALIPLLGPVPLALAQDAGSWAQQKAARLLVDPAIAWGGPLAAIALACGLAQLTQRFSDHGERQLATAAGVPLVLLLASIPALPNGVGTWALFAFTISLGQFFLWAFKAAAQ